MKCTKRVLLILSAIVSIYFLVNAVLHSYTDATYRRQRSKGIPSEEDNDSRGNSPAGAARFNWLSQVVDDSTLASYPSFLSPDLMLAEARRARDKSERQNPRNSTTLVRVKDKRNCRMENCFNFTRCTQFRVHIHPDEETVSRLSKKRSVTYEAILDAVRRSPFYTNNADEACILLLAFDTLDRDPISDLRDSSIDDVLLRRLRHWNEGMNHVVINFFGGTWPSYDEQAFGFDPGYAMLAKASSSETVFRRGFDLSMPLISTNMTEKDWSHQLPATAQEGNKRYLLGFKGKRYVIGIGSETRNALYHLSNRSANGDVLLLTTCRHGRNWQQFSDDRCAVDNEIYEQVDYGTLLHDARFCLVPRGRRLGSFRFLESLASGCVPVVLSNDWVLPFDSTIDWRTASVQLDERTLSIVPAAIRLLAADDAATTRLESNVRAIYAAHFSSLGAIVDTMLQELRRRVQPVLTVT